MDDHDNHDHYDDYDHDKASSSNAAVVLERVSQGKRPVKQQTEDIVWNNDLWQTERQQLPAALEKSNASVEQLQGKMTKLETTTAITTTNTCINNVTMGQTLMYKNTSTPPTMNKTMQPIIDVASIRNCTTANNNINQRTIKVGVIVGGGRSPDSTDSGTPYLSK